MTRKHWDLHHPCSIFDWGEREREKTRRKETDNKQRRKEENNLYSNQVFEFKTMNSMLCNIKQCLLKTLRTRTRASQRDRKRLHFSIGRSTPFSCSICVCVCVFVRMTKLLGWLVGLVVIWNKFCWIFWWWSSCMR